MGETEVSAYLAHLAVHKHVSASTQNQALSAILFLYRRVLNVKLEWLEDVVRAKRRLPVVLARQEVMTILDIMSGRNALISRLLYGTGMSLMEGLRLRVQDVDFELNEIHVRSAKGDKERVTTLPTVLIPQLKEQLERVKRLHKADLDEEYGRVYLPLAPDRKYPNACIQLGWQHFFPSMYRSTDPRSGKLARYHLHEKMLGGQLMMLHVKSASTKGSVATHYATALPFTCWNPDTALGQCRNYLVTRM